MRPSRDGNLAFIHVPKCGGTSVCKSITRLYPPRRITDVKSFESKECVDFLGMDLLEFRKALLVYELMLGGTGRFLHGHYPVDDRICERWSNDWTFVTVLRDPVERWISHYFFNLNSDSPFSVSDSLSDFLESPKASYFGTLYARFLGGLSGDDSSDISAAVAASCRTLDQMTHVGFVDQLDAFATLLGQTLSTRIDIGHLNHNRTNKSERNEQLTPAIMDRIREICSVDQEIYDYAAKRFRAEVAP
ncbi:MAG: sulfotransferase family 2 domain-containing protein [Planctomycetaceae bacterium]|nr:sulfotransferase family 2 domain-containing protein [Planctomycetaceae bacterium]